MAHEISIKDGVAEAAFAGQVPWHGLGTQVKEHMKPFEALELAHLNWEVALRKVFAHPQEEWPGVPESGLIEVPDRLAVCRQDNGMILGTVGPQYTPLQNHDQANFIEALVGEGANVECVGALFDGRRTFWTVRIPGEIQVGRQDKIQRYLILMNSHDGSTSFRAFESPIRVVCNNTLNVAIRGEFGRGGASEGFCIRHTKNIMDRIHEAQNVLGYADEYYKRLQESFQRFDEVKVDKPLRAGYFERVFRVKEEKKDKPRWQGTLPLLRDNYRRELAVSERTAEESTVWNLFNVVTDFSSHQMTLRKTDRLQNPLERNMESVFMGSGRALQQRAFKEAEQLVAEIN